MEEFESVSRDNSPSTDKERSEYEQQVQKTAAYMAALKVQVEKTFLDKKHEALERWMKKSQIDSHRTIKRVCNKAESVIHGMVEAKKKAMQDMVKNMEKELHEELKQLKEETRRKTLREFIQNNGRYLDKEKLTRIASLKGASENIENSQSIIQDTLISIKGQTPQVAPTIQELRVSGLASNGETRITAGYPKEISSNKKTNMDERIGDKEPICHTEMCLFTSLNQPQESHDKKCDQELESPKDVCVTIRDPNRGTLVTCQFDSKRMIPIIERDDEWSESNIADDESLWFMCSACSRTSRDMMMCSRCRDGFYCDEECQKNDWMAHQHTCTEYTDT